MVELDLHKLIEIINQTGFPISACVALFWLVNTTLKQIKEVLDELNIIIQNNTHAIEEVSKQIKDK